MPLNEFQISSDDRFNYLQNLDAFFKSVDVNEPKKTLTVYENIPDGTYQAVVKEASLNEIRKDGAFAIAINFQFQLKVDGEWKPYSNSIKITEKSMKHLKKTLINIGIDLDGLPDLMFSIDEMTNKPCTVSLWRSADGRYQNFSIEEKKQQA